MNISTMNIITFIFVFNLILKLKKIMFTFIESGLGQKHMISYGKTHIYNIGSTGVEFLYLKL